MGEAKEDDYYTSPQDLIRGCFPYFFFFFFIPLHTHTHTILPFTHWHDCHAAQIPSRRETRAWWLAIISHHEGWILFLIECPDFIVGYTTSWNGPAKQTGREEQPPTPNRIYAAVMVRIVIMTPNQPRLRNGKTFIIITATWIGWGLEWMFHQFFFFFFFFPSSFSFLHRL